MPFRKPPFQKSNDKLAFDVDDTDRSTSANQVPVSVVTCSGRLNPFSPTPVPPADHAQRVIIRNQATEKTSSPCQSPCSLQRLALQTKPVQQPQRTTQPTSDLVIALAKLTLQHEQERHNRARSENVVLQASASHPMMQRLEAMVEMYDQEGKKARANQEDQYVGHTQGKRHRLAENVRENQQVIEQRLQTEEMVAAALKRVLKVGEQAAQNRDLKALRCFRVKSKDEAGQDIVRWIFALFDSDN